MFFPCLFCLAQAEPIKSTAAESLSNESPSVLIDSEWLAARLRQPDVRILELGERDHYNQGHIPQAAFVDWIVDITDSSMPERYNVLSRREMEQLLRRLGIGQQTTVVLYDRLANRLSTRMFLVAALLRSSTDQDT